MMKGMNEKVTSWKRKLRKIPQKTEMRSVKTEGNVQIFPLVLLSSSKEQRDGSVTEFVPGAYTSLDTREPRLERNPVSVVSVGRPSYRHLS